MKLINDTVKLKENSYLVFTNTDCMPKDLINELTTAECFGPPGTRNNDETSYLESIDVKRGEARYNWFVKTSWKKLEQ